MNPHASNLITTTINAFNGDVAAISPMDGMSLVDSWLNALRDSDQNENPVNESLTNLKAELKSGNPDGERIGQLLTDATEQVRQSAASAETDVQTRLNALVEALEGFSQQLSGTGQVRDTSDRQAPMTSTVGGESTTSGAGASTLRNNDDNDDDDLTNRSIPASRNQSAMGMDDMTGAEGAARQDGGSYGSGYGTGSDAEPDSPNSGTDGPGISGDTAESGYGS